VRLCDERVDGGRGRNETESIRKGEVVGRDGQVEQEVALRSFGNDSHYDRSNNVPCSELL
jgi:hypothetical protein